jgi:DNA excision repair protein ERCC-2
VCPGLLLVGPAAGRVIRTPEDEGVLYLIDDRFTRPDVRRLLPTWWQVDLLRLPQPAPALDP